MNVCILRHVYLHMSCHVKYWYRATIHRVLLLSKSKKINCRLEFCAFLASTGHTEANVVPEKLIYRYTYELPAKTHCPDGPLGSIFWCYLGQPSKMAR